MKFFTWMIIQILFGAWLVLSPFVLGTGAPKAFWADTMLLGAAVVFLGVAMMVYQYYGSDPEKIADELHMGTHFRTS
ncbi:MAG TPA: hypothetical protein VLS90_07650 [Thermodesulfobacteriota bacterium]|nr:hypothetical protein [Thermodesulfobacteriota bacterium]